ncbi:MAG: hydrogenase maturation protease [Flavobacteriaceae bacterium]|nr:hydrogenase maturation protease [Flavobacteriaceae bacterium]
MKKEAKQICLILGIGNYGRQDDGLGWEFLDLLQKTSKAKHQFKLEYRYQLQIEDAELLCEYDNVVFVDASKRILEDGYRITKGVPSNQYEFTSHTLAPETILFLSNQLYNHQPNAYILEIEGFKWSLMNGLSIKAKINLIKAFSYFLKFLNRELNRNRIMEKI